MFVSRNGELCLSVESVEMENYVCQLKLRIKGQMMVVNCIINENKSLTHTTKY